MKKLIFLIFLSAISYGQTVTNGGFETNVFNRNTGERIYTEYYHENGQIYVQVKYKRGNLNGDVSFFDDKGQLIEIIKYKNGKPVNEGK